MNSLFVALLVLSGWNGEAFHPDPQTLRFSPEQLTFELQFEDGQTQACGHTLLKHVPWWRVQCAAREFTVDVWLQIHENSSEKLTKLTLMYHASEGVKSSGEKLVQFHNHFTSMIVDQLVWPKKLSSSLDIQNGLASLKVEVRL